MKGPGRSGIVAAREAALSALSAFRRNGKWPVSTLRDFTENPAVSGREASLAMRITLGVIQNMTLCDYYSSYYSSLNLKRLEPRLLDILRLSVYQIAFMEKVPRSASVNEGVALARKYANPRAAGYANAVLRRIADAAEKGDLPEVKGDAVQRLSILFSHPEWLTAMLCDMLGNSGAEKLMSVHNETETPLTAQVNTLISNTEAVAASLENEGVEVRRHMWLVDCVELRGAGGISRLESFRKGYFYIQDAAARLAVSAAAPKPGDFIIDGCAAPGGKSFAAAIAMKNKGRIASFDVSPGKLRLIAQGAERLGIGIIKAEQRDALYPVNGYIESADVVFADVPCSGFGVIRKKPEIRYKTDADTDALPQLQQSLLSSLSVYVKPGGVLLYSTCTFMRRENEDVIGRFLSDHDNFCAESFSLPGAGDAPDGMITLWPHIHGTDGFFICRLKRRP